MSKKLDLTGEVYGRLTVIKRIEKDIWLCECECQKISQVRQTHLRSGHTKSCGCLGKEKLKESVKNKTCFKIRTKEEFIKRAMSKHGSRFDYSKVEYTYSTDKVTIICKKHGEFKQAPSNHLFYKSCCPECSQITKVKNNKRFIKTTDNFIKKANKVHSNKYQYHKTDYQKDKKIIITCKKHGDFHQLPASHLTGSGCPSCRNSRGELKIRSFLYKNKINYIVEYSIKECRDKLPLRFDFAVFDIHKNLICLIEYNGIQHYQSILYKKYYSEENLKNIQKRDNIKANFCLLNNIPLLIIPYTDFDNIEIKINEFLKDMK